MVLDRHRDHTSHLGDAGEGQASAGLLVRSFRYSLHFGAIHARGHGVARFHWLRKHRPTSICGLLAEQAKQCSQQEKEGKADFHGNEMVERGLRSVND